MAKTRATLIFDGVLCAAISFKDFLQELDTTTGIEEWDTRYQRPHFFDAGGRKTHDGRSSSKNG